VEHPVFVALLQDTLPPRPRREGVLVSRHPRLISSVVAEGLRVASPPETLLAAASDLGELDLVAPADTALHRDHVTLEELRPVPAQRRRGRPTCAMIPRLDGRSESPWESVLRLLHQAADIEVQPQYEIEDRSGRFLARVDLWLVGTRRVHEYDGAVHRDAEQHELDLSRGAGLVRDDWERVGYTLSAPADPGRQHHRRGR